MCSVVAQFLRGILLDMVVEYMHRAVVILSVAVVFLAFLLLPYTLLLLLGQWLWTENVCCLLVPWNKYPRLKLRLKTILDPYHAPYKSECHYWTGLLDWALYLFSQIRLC